jgi:hypothetical protein
MPQNLGNLQDQLGHASLVTAGICLKAARTTARETRLSVNAPRLKDATPRTDLGSNSTTFDSICCFAFGCFH